MFKALKNFMYVQEPSATELAQVQPVQQVVTPGGGSVPPVPVQDSVFAQGLRQVLRNRSTAFTALLAGAEKLAAYIPDQTTRFKAAFEQVKGDGRSIRDIAVAIDIHAQDLTSQQMQFNSALDKESSSVISNLTTQINDLSNLQDQRKGHIARLAKEIADLEQQNVADLATIKEKSDLVVTETDRFKNSRQQFEVAFGIVKSELESQKSVILSALS